MSVEDSDDSQSQNRDKSTAAVGLGDRQPAIVALGQPAPATTGKDHLSESDNQSADCQPPVAHQLQALLAECQDETADAASAEVMARSVQIAEFVDQLISECAADWEVSHLVAARLGDSPQQFDEASVAGASDQRPDGTPRNATSASATGHDRAAAAHDTDDSEWAPGQPQLEFFRRLDAVNSQQPSPPHKYQSKKEQAATDEQINPQRRSQPLSVQTAPSTAAGTQQESDLGPNTDRATGSVSDPPSNEHRAKEQREEVLRFLLQHLKATHDQA